MARDADATPNGVPNESSSDSSDSEEPNQAQRFLVKSWVARLRYRSRETNWGLELLCGVTVALALVPEAVAFALSAGLPPAMGLHSAWIIALFTAILGGRPAMICGATGSLCVLVPDLLRAKHVDGHPGVAEGYMFVAVMLMGVIEICLGFLRVGSLVTLIPSPVMIGFCNGLALVIGLAQFNNYKELSHASDAARRLGSFDAFTDGKPFISGAPAAWAGGITALAFLVCLYLPKVTTRVPSALAAIALGTAFEWGIVRAAAGSATATVGDVARLSGSFPRIAWFDDRYQMPPANLDTFQTVLPLSITMAAVGLLESLMTLNLIDELTDTHGNAMRECLGQGVANIACGILGGMGGCAMIGQSMINIGSGARTRVSSATAGIVLLLIVMVLYPAINIIPTSALVGVMFNVVYHTFEWRSPKLLLLAAFPQSARRKIFSDKASRQKIRRADALVILVVTVVTLLTDLAKAVAAGMAVSCVMFVFDTASLIGVSVREGRDAATDQVVKYYDVHGVLFFGSCSQFLSLFDEKNDPDDVRLSFDTGYVADFSAIEALNKLGERYGALGKRVRLQQLKPGCGKVVRKAGGLLVKELDVSLESEEVLPAEREHFNVESFAAERARTPSGAHAAVCGDGFDSDKPDEAEAAPMTAVDSAAS